jgi:hypothetical protein
MIASALCLSIQEDWWEVNELKWNFLGSYAYIKVRMA